MDKHFDFYLTKVLKQWVVKHRPPADGRQRLLQKAATPVPSSPNKFTSSWMIGQGSFRPDTLKEEFSRKLTGWMFLPYQPGYGNISVV